MIPLMIAAGIFTHITARHSVARQTAAQAENPQTAIMNKLMLYVFPIGVVVGAPFLPLAVLLYWVANNLWTLGQQYVVYRRIDAEESREARRGGRRTQQAPRPGRSPAQKPVRPSGRADEADRPTTGRAARRRPARSGTGAKPVTAKPRRRRMAQRRSRGNGGRRRRRATAGTANGEQRRRTLRDATARAARRLAAARTSRPQAPLTTSHPRSPERRPQRCDRGARRSRHDSERRRIVPKTAQDGATRERRGRRGERRGPAGARGRHRRGLPRAAARRARLRRRHRPRRRGRPGGREHRRRRGPRQAGRRARGRARGAAGAHPARGAAGVGQPQPADARHRAAGGRRGATSSPSSAPAPRRTCWRPGSRCGCAR